MSIRNRTRGEGAFGTIVGIVLLVLVGIALFKIVPLHICLLYTSPPPPPVTASSNRSVMLVLSYLGILALIPLLTEKNDREVQWHAKHGLVLLVAYLVLMVGLMIASFVIGFLGVLQIPLWLGYLVVVILGITNALNGKRFVIPGVSEFAEKF